MNSSAAKVVLPTGRWFIEGQTGLVAKYINGHREHRKKDRERRN